MGNIDQETLNWLVSVPASDVNFKSNLKKANADTVQAAIEAVDGQAENKTKMKELMARLGQILDATVATSGRQKRTVNMDLETLQAEREMAQARQAEQVERERRIAECHQVIGRIQAVKMVAKFGNVSELMWINDVKNSGIYRDLPGVETWEKFCQSIGYSAHYINDQLKNLEVLGAELLETVSGLRVSFRDIKKLRQLTQDGAVTIDAEAVVIGEERIPMDSDHADELQAAIEKIIESKTALVQRVERLEKDVAAVVKEETKGLKVERDALLKEVKRLKVFDPEEKDHTWCAEQIKAIHDATANLSVLCGKVLIDSRVMDDFVVLGQVEGYIAGAEGMLAQLRKQWEQQVNLYEA